MFGYIEELKASRKGSYMGVVREMVVVVKTGKDPVVMNGLSPARHTYIGDVGVRFFASVSQHVPSSSAYAQFEFQRLVDNNNNNNNNNFFFFLVSCFVILACRHRWITGTTIGQPFSKTSNTSHSKRLVAFRVRFPSSELTNAMLLG